MATRKKLSISQQVLPRRSIHSGKHIESRPALQPLTNVHRRPAALKREVVTKVKSDEHKKTIVQGVNKKAEESNTEVLAKRVENVDLLGVKDIDRDDHQNLTLCAEYVKDIYRYLHRLEKRFTTSDYMGNQTELTAKMRSILIDWLVNVHLKFKLLAETLYLTVNIIDRVLERRQVKKSELQLVGVTAMLLASKYEEMYAPELSDFVYMTDNAYSKEQIKLMEQTILRVIDFDLSSPSCIQFLRRISKAGEVGPEKHILAKYLMELTLINYKFSLRLPSQIAAAAAYISLKVSDLSEWTPTLRHYSGYSEEEILPVVSQMAQQLLTMQTTTYDAVKNKYAVSKLLKVSLQPELKGKIIKNLASM